MLHFSQDLETRKFLVVPSLKMTEDYFTTHFSLLFKNGAKVADVINKWLLMLG